MTYHNGIYQTRHNKGRLTGTPGIIVIFVENATTGNTMVIPGLFSEVVMQQAMRKAAGKHSNSRQNWPAGKLNIRN